MNMPSTSTKFEWRGEPLDNAKRELFESSWTKT